MSINLQCKVTTKLEVNNGARLITSEDFILYYQWLIKKQFPWTKIQSPKYKSHITLVNPSIHGNLDLSKIFHLQGVICDVQYSVEMYRSPRNFWLPVLIPDIYHEIKDILNFQESKNWLGLHITIANTKFNVTKLKPILKIKKLL